MRNRLLFLLSFVFSRVLPAAPLPTKYLDWVPSGSASYMVEPSTGLKTTGFTIAKPTYQNMNWNFNLADSWIKYLKDERDSQATQITNLGNSITVLSGLVSAAEGDITSIQGDITSLESRMTTAESDISTLESTALLNPMDSTGDLIYGGSGGVATKLDAGASGQTLKSNGALAPTWASVLQMPNASGSLSSPTYSWDSSSSNTGFYLSATDAVGLSSNGTQSWNASATGVITTGPSAGALAHPWRGSLDLTVGSGTGTPTYGLNRNASNALDLYTNSAVGLSVSNTQAVTFGATSSTATHIGNGNTFKLLSGNSNANILVRNSVTGDALGFFVQQDSANSIIGNNSNGTLSLYTNGTEKFLISSAGAVTLGPAVSTSTHNFNGSRFNFNAPAATAAYSVFTQNAVAKTYLGVDNGTPFIPGLISGDTFLISTQKIALSADGGVTLHGSIGSTGAVTFGSIHNLGSGNITSGRYTPTLTSVTNIASTTPRSCMYSRVGNIVTVSGEIDVANTNTTTKAQLSVSVPIASNFTSGLDAGGTMAKGYVATNQSAAGVIYADPTSDTVYLEYMPVLTTNTTITFTFQYEIK